MNKAILYHYRRIRAHQLATYSNTGLHINGIDQRRYTGGGACYQYHAMAAYQSARRHVYFMKRINK